MNREEYNYCSSALRKLLSLLGEGDFRRRVKYRFGLQYNPRFKFYHLWDGEQAQVGAGTRATIKLLPEKAIMRLGEADFPFKEQMLKFQLPDRETIIIPSTHINTHDTWIHDRIQSHIDRRIQQRLAFLASKTQEHQVAPYTLRVTFQEPYSSYPLSASPTSVHQPGVSALDITFESPEHYSEMCSIANMVATELFRDYRVRWSHGYSITFSELNALYVREVETRRVLSNNNGLFGLDVAQSVQRQVLTELQDVDSPGLVPYSELIRRIQ